MNCIVPSGLHDKPVLRVQELYIPGKLTGAGSPSDVGLTFGIIIDIIWLATPPRNILEKWLRTRWERKVEQMVKIFVSFISCLGSCRHTNSGLSFGLFVAQIRSGIAQSYLESMT